LVLQPIDGWSIDGAFVRTYAVHESTGDPVDDRWLSADERRRAQRLVRLDDRRRWLHSRQFLREVLAQELGCDPARLQFGIAPGGKLLLVGAHQQALHFSLSHSATHVAVAVCAEAEVGVDIEVMQSFANLDEVAMTICEPALHQATVTRNPESPVEAFYRCWTFKEAVLKSVGWGLAHPMTRLPCAPGIGPPLHVTLRSIADASHREVVGRCLSVRSSLAGAVAVHRPRRP